jgi:hypothetical protein
MPDRNDQARSTSASIRPNVPLASHLGLSPANDDVAWRSVSSKGTVMNATTDGAALAGRIMLALMFIASGIGKIGGFTDTTVYMASAGLPAVDPMLEILLILTILIELGGGTAIVLGWKTRLAALTCSGSDLTDSVRSD